MSIYFIRCVQQLSVRAGPSKFLPIINAQSDRNYHFENSGVLRKSAKQWTAANYLNVRNITSNPPELPGLLGSVQWHNYRGSMIHIIEEFAHSNVVLMAQEYMIAFHDYIGLPWWSVIVITTLAARTFITLPFAIHQQYVSGKYEQVQREMDTTVDKEVIQKVRKLAEDEKWNQRKLTEEYHLEKKRRRVELIKKYNCHPLKLTVMMLIQAPIWTTMSCVLRNLTYMHPIQDSTAQIVHAEMKLNSFLWMSDLTVPDPVLPVTFTIANMILVSSNVIARKGKKTHFEKIIIIFHSTFFIMLSTFAVDLPLSILLYWTTSAWYSVIQNLTFLSPKVRARLNIPLSQNIRLNALQKCANTLKSIYKFIRY